jgi:hypothetical protein
MSEPVGQGGPGVDRRIPIADRVLIALLMLVYVLVGMHTTIATDTARDLIAAWDIVQGTHYPLRGPELYTTWTLGPLWYYLLALPLALTHSAAVAALMIAMLAALKFPLAYRLGAAFGDATLARFAVLAIALPGWWLFEWLVTSHTNLAVPCLLACAAFALRWARGGSAWTASMAALMFALALHAHPTSLLWAWIAVPALYARYRRGGLIPWAHLAAAAGLFVLPFVPMLIAEAASGWPMLAGTQAFVAARTGPSLWSRWPAFVVDLLAIDGARMSGQFLGASWLRMLVIAVVGSLWVLALAGMLAGWRSAGRIAAPAALLWGAAFVVWLRPEVPYWMVYALMPALAAVLALGWQSATARLPPAARGIGNHVIAGLVLAVFLVVAAQRGLDVESGWVNVPYRVVGRYADPHKRVDTTVPNAAYPVVGIERWVRSLCAEAQALSLHGDGAALQRMSQGTLRALHCADDRHWRIGGSMARSIALYPNHALRAAGVVPERTFGAMGSVPVVDVLHAAASESDDLVRAYPPWPLTQQPDRSMRVPIPAEVSGVVAVSNLRVVFNGLEAPELVVDGRTVPPVVRTAGSWLFRVPPHATGELRIRTGDPRRIEVLQLAAH